MKQVASNALGPLLLSIAVAALQGCDGGGSGTGDPESGGTQASQRAPAAAGAPAAPAAASLPVLITLFPTSGPPGSTLAARGEGFAGQCGVELFIDGLAKSLGNADVSRDGRYSTQVIVPEDTTEGPHTVIVRGRNLVGQVCSDPSATTAEATFTVVGQIPLITLETIDARPGTAVEVRGRGFCTESACTDVTIMIDGQVGVSGVKVGSDGTFVAEALVPAISAAGSVAVVATQKDPDGVELRAFGEISVTVRPNRSPIVIR